VCFATTSVGISENILNDCIASISEDFVKAGDDSNDNNEMTEERDDKKEEP